MDFKSALAEVLRQTLDIDNPDRAELLKAEGPEAVHWMAIGALSALHTIASLMEDKTSVAAAELFIRLLEKPEESEKDELN